MSQLNPGLAVRPEEHAQTKLLSPPPSQPQQNRRSHAASHERTQLKRKRNGNRFPVRARSKVGLSAPTSIYAGTSFVGGVIIKVPRKNKQIQS